MTPASADASAGKADRVSAILLLLFGGFIIVQARALPYWTTSAPGPGFLPFWLGVLLACAAAVMFVRTFGRAEAGHGTTKALPHADRATVVRLAAIVGMTAGAAALSLLTGMVLASGVFMGATLAYLRPGHTRANWIAALLTPIVVWLLFVRWLAVPLPIGLIGY